MTNRFGFSRNNGSIDGSKSMTGSVLIAEKSFFLLSSSAVVESKFILRILLRDTPSEVELVIGLIGLYIWKIINKREYCLLLMLILHK